jgi:uncharacterized repeat protein (TIGR03803 family)
MRPSLSVLMKTAFSVFASAAMLGGSASASTLPKVIYNFSGGSDGGNAATGIVVDAYGNLYGTTVIGGQFTCGTVFELSPSGSRWQESVLYNFGCFADGKSPHGGVTFDPAGNLDGTTVAGGSGGSCTSDGCGVAFSLSPTAQTVLYNFRGSPDGWGPGNAVVYDGAGNVYGETPDGGSHGMGTVYQLSQHNGTWHERIIHNFSGGRDGGVGSLGSLLIDAAGHLFGVTEVGGRHAAGTVFELSQAHGRWEFKTLHEFEGMPDAGSPYGGLVADGGGNLYGTTYYGGKNGAGAVYEIYKNLRGEYKERLLYSFKGGADGANPTSTLMFGKPGILYGTTSAGGGSCGCGTVFTTQAKSGSEQVIYSFGSSANDGQYPYYGLTLDAHGNLYGTTVAGGRYGQGTVFAFTP